MRNILKKLTAGLLVVAISAGAFGIMPREAKALYPVQETGTSLFQQIAHTFSLATSAAADYGIQFKEYVLDPIASGLVKAIIRQFTDSIVNWINNGFEGSPSFVENPGGFFLDMADQLTGDFLNKYGGPLTELCSPFSLDIRLALSFKYHKREQTRYSCTLSTIIKNAKNSDVTVNGASMKGFVDGDFNQGGWPAFVALNESQNNVYGAYLTADSELSLRVANAEVSKRQELSNGRGFLSWRDPKCKAEVKANNDKVRQSYQDLEDGKTPAGYVNGTNGELGAVKSINDCPIKTPGSVIQGTMQNHLDGPLRELEIADEIDEILNAALTQLVTMTLQKGLGAITGGGPSDSSSYLNQIRQEEIQAGNSQLNDIRNEFLQSIQKYVTDTSVYKNYKDQSLKLYTDVKDVYDGAKACYGAKIANNQPPLTAAQKALAEAKILELDSIINREVMPTVNQLQTEAWDANRYMEILDGWKTKATNAKTLNDVNQPSAEFSRAVRADSLVNGLKISNAQQQYAELQEPAAAKMQTARIKAQECNLFPNGVTYNSQP